MKSPVKISKYKRKVVSVILTAFAGGIALLFVMPMIITVVNSLMEEREIQSNYGVLFSETTGGLAAGHVNLKLIPDWVSLQQYFTVLLKSPDYLFKLWNSLFLVVPIVVFQLMAK